MKKLVCDHCEKDYQFVEAQEYLWEMGPIAIKMSFHSLDKNLNKGSDFIPPHPSDICPECATKLMKEASKALPQWAVSNMGTVDMRITPLL